MNFQTRTAQANSHRSVIADGHSLLELARGWLRQGNPAVAHELLDSAFRSPEAGLDPDLRAQVLKETGRMMMMESSWSLAEGYYLEAQTVFLENHNYRGAAECARNLANAMFQTGRFNRAEQLCVQALGWANEVDDPELRATILNTMGAILSEQGRAEEAIVTFRLCLADFRAARSTVRQGYVLLNIGLAQIELGKLCESLESLNEALALALREKDQHLVEICYQNIAKSYLAQNEVRLARSVIETARKILPGLNSKALEMELSLLEARIVRAQGDFRSADAMLEAMLPVVTEFKLEGLAADLLLEKAHVARLSGAVEVARSLASSASQQYAALGARKGEAEATRFMGDLNGSHLPHE